MLHCELSDNTKKYAPEAHSRIFLDQMSPERRSAMLEAVHTLYASRAGDTLFTGVHRHKLLAKYIETPEGWSRVQRLASWVYTHGMWARVEANRLERERQAEIASLASRHKEALRAVATEHSYVGHWKDRRTEAAGDLAYAEKCVKKGETDLATAKQNLREVEQKLADLGGPTALAS